MTLFTDTLKNNQTSKKPVWFMRQAGRYLPEYKKVRATTNSFLEFCYNPELASKVTMQPIDRFDFDAAIIFSDILVIPDALGQQVEFIKGQGPVLQPIKDGVDGLNFNKEKLDPVYEAIKLTRSELSTDKSLIGFAGSPWTLATYMIEGKGSRDFASVRQLAYEDEGYFSEIIDILVDSVSQHLIGQVNAGVDVLQLFDSWSGVLPWNQFEKWVISPTAKIVEKVKSIHPEIPIIGFPKGCGTFYPDYAKDTGVDAVSFDFCVRPKWVKDNINIPVQGNLDPILLASDKEAAMREAKTILDVMADQPFIFNLGHGILPHTPIENVESIVNLVKNY